MSAEQDYACAVKIYDVMLEFIKKEQGSYIPIHVASGQGFLRALSDEIAKITVLKPERQ